MFTIILLQKYIKKQKKFFRCFNIGMINPVNSINFKAYINFDRQEINQKLSEDKKMESQNMVAINKILDKVDTFSKMPEDSVVNIDPMRCGYNNVFKLLCKVSDKDNLITRIISERGARKLSSDEEFADRYVNNIQKAISDVEIEGEAIKQIKDVIINSKTIKGIASYDEKRLRPMSKEETADYFIDRTKYSIDEKFIQNVNPTERIISILKKLDESKPETDKYISIGRLNKGPTRFKVIFENQDKTTSSVSIPLSTLLYDTSDNLLK